MTVPSDAETEKHIRDLVGPMPGGADVVLDFVGAPATVDLARAVVSTGGHISVVGLGGGALAVGYGTIPFEVTVRLPFWGTRAELAEVLALARAGRIRAQVQEFSLDSGGHRVRCPSLRPHRRPGRHRSNLMTSPAPCPPPAEPAAGTNEIQDATRGRVIARSRAGAGLSRRPLGAGPSRGRADRCPRREGLRGRGDPADARAASDVALRGAGRHPLDARADRAARHGARWRPTIASSSSTAPTFAKSRKVLERTLRDGTAPDARRARDRTRTRRYHCQRTSASPIS